jgi:arylsulfatase A-like enzyme
MGGADVPPVVRERAVAAYDGEIRYTDDIVRRLLAAFDAQPHPGGAVAVLCSDHGEAFWERGSPAHGNNLHEEEIRVPLVLRGKGVPAGMRIWGQVGLIDVAPTLLDLAGIPAPESWRGRSLMPAMLGAPQPETPLVLDNRIQKRGIQRGVRTSRWKLSAWPPHDAPGELYDLAADPGETNNLARAGAPLPAEVQTLVPLLKPTK